MTIYIAGKMTGEPDLNRPKFNLIESRLHKDGHKVLNPARIGDLPNYEMYWPINRAMLAGADAIYMLDGWQDSPGATKELFYAITVGLPILFENKKSMYTLLDRSMHSKRVSGMPTCNTCSASKECPHVPRPGMPCRINCHLWDGRER